MQNGLVLVIVGMAGLTLGCASAQTRDEVNTRLEKTLTASARPAYVTKDAEGKKLWALTKQFYERRGYEPAWLDGTNPRPRMRGLLAALSAAEDEGLDPELYNVSLLVERREEADRGFISKKGFDPGEAGTLEVWLTYLYMKYASDLAEGLSDLARADPKWQIRPAPFNPVEHLATAIEEDRVEKAVLSLRPENPQYVALRKALATYRKRAEEGGWPQVPAGLRLKPGQKSPHVRALALRLAASGDYSGRIPGEEGPQPYDTALQEAVKRFQRRHGLVEDGIVGAPTAAELNIPIERRIEGLRLNLERWRWLPRELGDTYVLVNIPEYRLEVWEKGRVPLTMRVVVGKEDTPTPIFNDRMSYLVFSPYWNVPPDIAAGETIPALLKDPDFLARNDMEVLDKAGKPVDPLSIDIEDPTKYRFRQRPGAGNSLGLVKFMFPNQYHVYLHDTPASSLFARASRSFSHGCVRVEEPVALAEYLLRDQREWDRQEIAKAMSAGEEKTVKLREPVPVYLGYWTARVDDDGEVHFRKDVYGIDRRQTTLLADRVERMRKSAEAAARAAAASPDGRATARSSE